MTKKDYETIAKVLYERRKELISVSSCTTIDKKDESRIAIDSKLADVQILMNMFAQAFEKDQEFDEKKFFEMCG